ncbi:hydantoinase B/oxoprolinase family protein [Oceanibacterium hippocampi]|uniref:Acetophenone carboxylase delta subunit n=1 Tax=Oceanibacterium hippocampi TaxID=745714 RepID=A0A1Y5TJ82_9PROT|nr:hydantoinase B/oxoprolinase family protein [Oceanibacterium hippocampi]SLN64875.1 Acetophenone carboxylase delta subunit [Oceanibacterium hippocampi]
MDPVRTEIMKNRFAAIAEEAASIAYRTAHTTYVKQTQDFQCALATRDGHFFAFPRLSGVTTSVGQNIRTTVDLIGEDNLAPGDVIITNDPFGTQGLCTHTMDVHLIRPIFRDGRLLCHAWSFIHASDIGGAVPGSISPVNSEVYQEGIRLRAVKLYDRSVLNSDVLNVFLDNSRIPDLIWGDIKAMLAGMKTLDRRVNELCDRYGEDEFQTGIEEVLDFAELKARGVIAEIPDGEYAFSDYLEGYSPGEFIFLHAALKIAGDQASIDFAGSDPQVQYALNFTSSSGVHPFLCLALTNYIHTRVPDIPMNGGIMRPIRTSSPKGTIMNAEFPAAMGNRWVTAMRMYDVILGCLAQAVPGGLAAAGAGQAGIISVSGRDHTTGLRRVSVVEPIVGGSGARAGLDGIDGTDIPIAFLRSAPFEYVEIETPLIMRRYSLGTDLHGKGRTRGGGGVVTDMENGDVEAVITVRGLDRTVFAPWGFEGGTAGTSGTAIFNPDGDAPEELGKVKVLDLRQGDVLRLITPSGGGFGDPLERDPARVLEDVRDGFVSLESAARDYGVTIVDDAVDDAATDALRARIRDGRKARAGAFDLGDGRRTFEKVWPEQASVALALAVFDVEPGLRPHVLRAVRARFSEAEPATPEAARAAVGDWVARLGRARAAVA